MEETQEEKQLDLRDILGVLYRHVRLIAVTFVAVVGLASVVVFSLKPVYTASALVLVDTSRKNLLDSTDAPISSSSDSARVDSEVELAKSETVLLEVVNDLKLFEMPEFAYRPGLMTQALNFLRIRKATLPTGQELLNDTLSRLRDAVSVQRRGLTFLISVQAKSADPALAAKLANSLAKTYISEQLKAKINSTLASRDVLQARLADSSAAVATSEDAIDKFISANIGSIQSETGRVDLGALNDQISQQDQVRSRLAAMVQKASASLQSRDYAALTTSLQSAAVANLEAQRRQLQASLDAAANGSKTAIDLKAELAKVQNSLDSAASAAIGGLRQQISEAQSHESDLRQQLRNGVLSSNLSSTTLTLIYELQQTSEIARTQYQTLLTRVKDLDQQAYLQVADSRVASEALPPDIPSFPNPRLLLSLAAVLGAGLGVGLAFLYENFIGGIVSEEQLRAIVKTRSVLSVPVQKEFKGANSLADAVLTAPLSAFSESIRKIRVSVDQALGRRNRPTPDERSGAVVLVTSTASNEGKTTTALALARAYSLTGRTVLLIDCDLRKPSLHRQLGREPTTALIDHLANTPEALPLASIVSVDESSGIGVLLGSRRSNSATDQLVAGGAFSRLVGAAVKSYDIVILDAPPVGPVVDGVYLAQFADVVVFVVKWASTSQSEARSGMRTVVDAVRPDVEVISVLAQTAGHSRSYYGKYTGYYSESSRDDT